MIKNEQARKRIGQRIAEIRKNIEWTDEQGIRRKGMTQAELAQRIETTRPYLIRIEQGKYGVGLDILSSIADALGCTIDFVKP